MNNQKHKAELLETTTTTLNNTTKLPLYPNNKLNLYSNYFLSKSSWHLTIADIPETWVKENLDSLCRKKLRSWLEIPINGTLDTVQLPKSKLGLNIIDISTKYAQCQVTIRKKLSTSRNDNIKCNYESTKYGSNIRYDNCRSCKDVLANIKNKKVNINNNLTSQSLVIKSLWEESTTYGTKIWQNTIKNLPKNIFSFVTRDTSNTSPTSKNMVFWGIASNSLCKFCLDTQTLQHVVSGCKPAPNLDITGDSILSLPI